MIAIPDFSAGAMENWGLITYREVAILYEEGKSSRSDKEYVAVVVAHELAHQVTTFFENFFLKQNRSGLETLLPWSGGQTCGSMKGNHHFLTKRSKPNHQVCIVHRIHWDEPCESGNGNSRQICA